MALCHPDGSCQPRLSVALTGVHRACGRREVEMALQGVDAEGGSPSSAAPGPQLKGAWGSGSIASRLAQVQKGEHRRMHHRLACPGDAPHADPSAHAGHWSENSALQASITSEEALQSYMGFSADVMVLSPAL